MNMGTNVGDNSEIQCSQPSVKDETALEEMLTVSSSDGREVAEEIGGLNKVNSLDLPRKTCALCHNKARYCCPRCGLRSCSLVCVKEHKAQTLCNGIRDKAAFIPMNKFTDLDLLSDYRFLEESARMVDKAARNRIVKPHWRENIPSNLNNMQKFAWRRNRISVHFLPQTFVRRKRNRTSIKRSKLHWTVECQMPQGQLVIVKDDIPSSTTIKALIVQLLENLSTSEKEQAAALIHASIGDICVLMKVVGRPSNEDRYFEFDVDASLEENLRGKRLIEYPTLIIITKDHRAAFQLEESSNNIHQTKQTELPSFFRGDVDSENEGQIDHDDRTD